MDTIPSEILESIFLLLPPKIFFRFIPSVCRRWHDVARVALGDDGRLTVDCHLTVRKKVGWSVMVEVKVRDAFAVVNDVEMEGVRKGNWSGVKVFAMVDVRQLGATSPDGIVHEVGRLYDSKGLPLSRIRSISVSSCHQYTVGHSKWLKSVASSLTTSFRPAALNISFTDLDLLGSLKDCVFHTVKALGLYGTGFDEQTNFTTTRALFEIFPSVQTFQMDSDDLSNTFATEAVLVASEAGVEKVPLHPAPYETSGPLQSERYRLKMLLSHFGPSHNCSLDVFPDLMVYFPELAEIGFVEISSDSFRELRYGLEGSLTQRFPSIRTIHFRLASYAVPPDIRQLSATFSAIAHAFPFLQEMTLSFYKWGPNFDHSFVRQFVLLSPVRHVRLIGHLDHLWETHLHRVLVGSGKRISWERDSPYIDYFNSGFKGAK